MKNFLVCLDFSDVTEDVLDAAVDFARAFGGALNLLHVLPDFTITEGAEALAREQLEASANRIRQAGVNCTAELRLGAPAPVIVEAARHLRADFILMGSHGHGQLYSMVVGSVAHAVIKKASCGVILLPPDNKAYD